MTKPSTAGGLRHWLTFQTLVTENDSDGALVETWIDAFPFNPRMPCAIEVMSGREFVAAAAVQSKATCRIRARYRPGFNAVQRAVAPDGTTYNIEAILQDNESGRRWVIMPAYTGTNAGGTAT